MRHAAGAGRQQRRHGQAQPAQHQREASALEDQRAALLEHVQRHAEAAVGALHQAAAGAQLLGRSDDVRRAAAGRVEAALPDHAALAVVEHAHRGRHGHRRDARQRAAEQPRQRGEHAAHGRAAQFHAAEVGRGAVGDAEAAAHGGGQAGPGGGADEGRQVEAGRGGDGGKRSGRRAGHERSRFGSDEPLFAKTGPAVAAVASH